MPMHRRTVTPPAAPPFSSLHIPSGSPKPPPPPSPGDIGSGGNVGGGRKKLKLKSSSLEATLQSGRDDIGKRSAVDDGGSIKSRRRKKLLLIVGGGCFLVICAIIAYHSFTSESNLGQWDNGNDNVRIIGPALEKSSITAADARGKGQGQQRLINRQRAMIVSSTTTSDNTDSTTSSSSISYTLHTSSERRQFMELHGHKCYKAKHPSSSSSASGGAVDSNTIILRRYDNLPYTYQIELWKYCALYLQYGTGYVDLDIGLLQTYGDTFADDTKKKGNYAVLVDTSNLGEGASSTKNKEDSSNNSNMVHSSILIISEPYSPVAEGMVRLIVETSNAVLRSSPFLLPRELYRLIMSDEGQGGFGGGRKKKKTKSSEKKWTLLPSKCQTMADPSSGGGMWDGINVLPSKKEKMSQQIEEEMVMIDGENVIVPKPSPVYLEDVLTQRRKGYHMQGDSGLSLVGTGVTPDANSRRLTHHCPIHGGYCCTAYNPSTDSNVDETGGGAGAAVVVVPDYDDPVLVLRHPVGGDGGHNENNNNKNRVPTDANQKERNERKKEDGYHHPKPYAEHMAKEVKGDGTTTSGYHVPEADLPFISTVRVHERIPKEEGKETSKAIKQQQQSLTPNFFDILLQNDCLPTQKACHKCLKSAKNNQGGSCDKCQDVCFCYCRVLCQIRPPKKRVVKEFWVYPPVYRKDVERLVPRIVHQTWFEPVTKEKYPNMSRLIESWKRSGWEYNFYDDETAGEFLSTHFPKEVREAYESIIPGAFKADLFRYCVLLIRGGVYADMDVLLESNLDEAVANDVGFMTPIDEPGIKVGHRSCLWNGLLAVSPGHPFLAKTIEIVVNNIRNRFTSVDYDDMLCPNPILSVTHTVDTLFTCGPCILGAAMNTVLGRHMQDQWEIGDVDIWGRERRRGVTKERLSQKSRSAADEEKPSVVVSPDDPRLLIPGRTIILQQNKNDMGAHRFTWVERNLMVAATDMPDYDDRPPSKEHYSKTHEKVGVYGLKKLYVDNVSADEEIRVIVKKS